jgi:hypothetical protein
LVCARIARRCFWSMAFLAIRKQKLFPAYGRAAVVSDFEIFVMPPCP